MIVEFDSDRYSVKWKYQKSDTKHLETVCLIKNLNTGKVIQDHALKSPNDNHNKHIGRKISLARALKVMGLNREQRKIFWDAYLKNCKVI